MRGSAMDSHALGCGIQAAVDPDRFDGKQGETLWCVPRSFLLLGLCISYDCTRTTHANTKAWTKQPYFFVRWC